MPGIIDLNVNTQSLASKEWEGFEFCTSAAASGGVTTMVDMPTMKKPSLTYVSALHEHLEGMTGKLKIDSIQLAYMTQEHVEEIQSFYDDGTVFGFFTSFQQPLNRKLGTMVEAGFEQLIRKVSGLDPNMLVFVEAMKAEDRHMYAKSPFRKEKRGKRLSCDIPKSLSIMGGMAFADDNHDNSSQSEDEAKGYELSIDRIEQKPKFNSGALLFAPELQKKQYLELNSATIRSKIKEMRDDISKIAESELLMYEQDESKEQDEDSSESQDESENSNQFHRAGFNISIGQLESQKQRKNSDHSTKSTPLVSKLKVTSLNENSNENSQNISHRSTPSRLKIKKEQIHFGSQMRKPTTSLKMKGVVKEEPDEDSSPVIKRTSHLEVVEQNSPQSASLQLRKGGIEEVKKNFSQHAQRSDDTIPSKIDSLKIERTRPTLTVTTLGNPSHQRKASLRDSKPSPLTGTSTGNSLLERRRKMLHNKNSGSDVISTETNGSALTPIIPTTKAVVTCDDSPQFGNNLVPLNTKKMDGSTNSQDKLQQSYKYFLSMNTTNFEDNGVSAVNQVIQSIENFVETGCKIHFTVLSTNKCFDRIRDLKKKHVGYDQRISYEITAHHLYFTEKDIQDKDVIMKCSPPIRDERENLIFALSLRKKYFDAITSAHFPVSPEYKLSVQGNFLKAFSGVSTLGFSLQALWTLFNDKRDMFKKEDETEEGATCLFFQSLVYAFSERPAQILGIDSQKGTLRVGKHCDLLVFDPNQHYKVDKTDIYSRFPEISIYNGRIMYGRITETYLRGKQVFSKTDEQVLLNNFHGKVMRRSEFRQ